MMVPPGYETIEILGDGLSRRDCPVETKANNSGKLLFHDGALR
jgi:hypothetical protein